MINFKNEVVTTQDGICLPTQRAGSGPTVLCLHGGPGLGLKIFAPELYALANSTDLVLFDQRGCNATEGLNAEQVCNIRNHVKDVEAVRQFTGAENVILLGHSFGCYLAANYALQHPGSVRVIIMLCPPTMYPETPQQIHRWYEHLTPEIRRSVSRIVKTARSTDERVNRATDLMAPLMFHEESGLELFRQKKIHISGLLADTCVNRKDFITDIRPQLGKLDIPVSIVAGKEDKRTPPEYAEETLALLPEAEMIIMERTGHFPFLEHPQECVRIIKKIIASWH